MRGAALAALALAAVTPEVRAQSAFFRADSVLSFTIRADLRRLRADRDPDTNLWREATITWDSAGHALTRPLQLRTRGLYRLRHCDFPPLRMRFAPDSVRGTPWQGLRRPKLLTHCMNRAGYDQNVLQEYAIYRVLRLFTDAAYAARLVRVTWEDAAGRDQPLTRWAAVIEDPDRLVDRLHATVLPGQGTRMTRLPPGNAALLGTFQYFIANTDWSVPGLHNIELLQLADSVVAVWYDFDWSGVINAPYARPDPRLPIRAVTDRVYRGLCQDAPALEPVLARFEALRDSIMAVYRAVPGLEPRQVERTGRYYGEFYEAIANRKRFVEQVVRPDCLH